MGLMLAGASATLAGPPEMRSAESPPARASARDRSTAPGGSVSILPPALTSGRIEEPALESALQRARTRLGELVTTPDLIESLYFGWFDRPYRRATIAVALKTVAVLERELGCRRAGNPAISDRELLASLHWLDDALHRAVQPPRRPGFLPHRRSYEAPRHTRNGTVHTVPSRFAFQDRASVTRASSVLGDFDLLACLGTGVCGPSPRTISVERYSERLAARAAALAIGVVATTDGETPPLADVYQPLTLTELISGSAPPAESGVLPAIADPPRGEGWGASLARRSLFHGTHGQDGVVSVGWVPPTSAGRAGRNSGTSAIQPAMWVHSLGGQRLGLIEGWRDLRDGSRLPYRPLVTRPERIEAMAHTALDLIHFAPQLGAFSSRPRVAVVIGYSAVDPTDGNRWSDEAGALFDMLLDRQLCFDVLPLAMVAAHAEALAGYRAVLIASDEDEAAPILDHVRTGVARVSVSAVGSFAELRQAIESLPAPIIDRDLRDPSTFVAFDEQGQVARMCLVFTGQGNAGQLTIAVVNLLPDARTVILKGPGPSSNQRYQDLLAGDSVEVVGGRLALAGHQVCLLSPSGASPLP
ncbi:MAG: hypothetical protein GY842_19115 [bacterium]|nr:hypothetical protein [bacterium]